MPAIKSAIKRVKIARRNQQRNQSVREAVKTAFRKARVAVEAVSGEALNLVRAAASAIDKAACSGIIHKNTASRKKSRLFLKYNASLGKQSVPATAAAGGPVKEKKKPAAQKTEAAEKAAEKPAKTAKAKK